MIVNVRIKKVIFKEDDVICKATGQVVYFANDFSPFILFFTHPILFWELMFSVFSTSSAKCCFQKMKKPCYSPTVNCNAHSEITGPTQTLEASQTRAIYYSTMGWNKLGRCIFVSTFLWIFIHSQRSVDFEMTSW